MPLNKLQPAMHIRDAGYGAIRVSYPNKAEGVWDQFYELAGARWISKDKHWIVAEDYLNEVKAIAEANGWPIKDRRDEARDLYSDEVPVSGLRPYQIETLNIAKRLPSLGLSFETGLGKTVTAIKWLETIKGQRILIVCPASVRETWADEFEKWDTHTVPPTLLYERRMASSLELIGPDTICLSYDLLPYLRLQKWDAIVFDESHHLKNPESQQGRAAWKIRQYNPRARVLCLTATPLSIAPQDMWHPSHLLYPHRYGSYWQFAKRYHLWAENEFGGVDLGDSNAATAPELRRRMALVWVRKTKAEVADDIPPLIPQAFYVEAEKQHMRELSDRWDTTDIHRQTLDQFTMRAGHAKVAAVRKHLLDQGMQGRICVLTHFRETAKNIAEDLSRVATIPVFHVDGGVPPKKRAKVLTEAAKNENCIVVTTMHAVEEGINTLMQFPLAVCAELYWSPKTLEQVVGRFHRLGTVHTPTFHFLILKGTLDEQIAKVVLRRIDSFERILDQGANATAVRQALGEEKSEEEMLEDLRAAVASGWEDDEYGG